MIAMELAILSVNAAQPKIIVRVDGTDIFSAIAKETVDAETIAVTALGLAGDAQADLSVHGGPDQAVYAYPTDHWPWWESKGLACHAGTFGENLTVAGADESAVNIGDRFAWGEVMLEVTRPRAPRFKFRLHTGRKDAPPLMTLSARTGWYFRVLAAGAAPVRHARLLRTAAGTGPTVRAAFLERYGPAHA